MGQTAIRAVYMRGGTSRAIVFREQDLPASAAMRDAIFAAALGSPDPGKRQLGQLEGLAGIAACTGDQASGEAFAIIKQHLEQMLGRKLLVALAGGKRLRGLDEPAGAFGIFIKVHGKLP